VPKNFGSNVTSLVALSCTGLDGVITVDSATDTAVLRAFGAQVLVVDDIVVMDNLSVHKVSGIREICEAVGARLIYLPPYSPDYWPIESCWPKLRTRRRKAKPRTREALDEALRQAVDDITESDAKGGFSFADIPYVNSTTAPDTSSCVRLHHGTVSKPYENQCFKILASTSGNSGDSIASRHCIAQSLCLK